MTTWEERREELYDAVQERWDARPVYQLQMNEGVLPQLSQKLNDRGWKRVLQALKSKLEEPRMILPYVTALVRREIATQGELERRRSSPVPTRRERTRTARPATSRVAPRAEAPPTSSDEPSSTWLDELDMG